IAAVANRSRVKFLGIDIEPIIASHRENTIYKMVANKVDLELIKLTDPKQRLLVLTLLFSAKEALYKALYPEAQCYIGFKEASLIQLSLEQQRFKLELISDNPKLNSLAGEYGGRFMVAENFVFTRSEEHTSELQSRENLV